MAHLISSEDVPTPRPLLKPLLGLAALVTTPPWKRYVCSRRAYLAKSCRQQFRKRRCSVDTQSLVLIHESTYTSRFCSGILRLKGARLLQRVRQHHLSCSTGSSPCASRAKHGSGFCTWKSPPVFGVKAVPEKSLFLE